ncbi:hypothetical protein [Paenibacillus cremeus]|uniref:hypothetical protein n=1 Tax=Paenibacillus cremeus TaxID=2163881 RepID=UPI0016456488|nr:hypothetical protein [Paenibacillus cremeus]
MLGTLIVVNLITGVVGATYMGASLGSKMGKRLNKKIHGKYSKYNEIVTIAKGSDLRLK